MNKIYYQLSLKTKQKPPKQVFLTQNLKQLKSLLNITLKNARTAKNNNNPTNILKLLDKIIPNEYFGTTRHRKLFYQLVKRILTQSTHECIHTSVITKGYDLKLIPWLNRLTTEKIDINVNLLLQYNLLILDNVVKPLIAFYYKPIRTYVGHEVQFIERRKWSSFESKAFHCLQSLNYIEKTESVNQSRGNLIIVPKGPVEDLKFRPIVSIFPDNKDKALYKQITSKVYLAARKMRRDAPTSLYDNWKSFVEKTQNDQIYGVKLDIRDAYGNVDIKILCILLSALKNEFLSENEIKFVINHVTNQYITFRRKIYRWKHGLLQGDRLSSCLCELYMSDLDRTFLARLKPNCFMDRTVDDYVFCSTEGYNVYNFIKDINTVHPVNKGKTKTNILQINNEVIPYCGKLFNLVTKEVKKLYVFNDHYDIRHKFKIWNYKVPISEANGLYFLKRSMNFSYNNNCFTKMEMNTVFNSQRTVLENFFEGMVNVAYKFDAVVMAIRYVFPENTLFVLDVLKAVVCEYSMKVSKKIENCKGDFYKEAISTRHLRVLSWKAFILVFKRRNEIYKNVVAEIKTNYNLRLNFQSIVDHEYFYKLPSMFKDVKINRSVSV